MKGLYFIAIFILLAANSVKSGGENPATANAYQEKVLYYRFIPNFPLGQ